MQQHHHCIKSCLPSCFIVRNMTTGWTYFPSTETKLRVGFILTDEACARLCFLLDQLQTAVGAETLETSWHQKSIFIPDFKAPAIKIAPIRAGVQPRTNESTSWRRNKCNIMFTSGPDGRQACLNIEEQKGGVRVYLGLRRETLVGLSSVFISAGLW